MQMIETISNDVIVVITYLQNCEIGPWLMNTNRPIRYVERKIGPIFSLLLETLEQNGGRAGQKSGERERSGERV